MIKRLLGCVREYKRDAILAPIYVFLEVVLDVIIPLYMGRLIDRGIDQGDMGYVVKIGLVLVVMCILSLACGTLSGRRAAVAAMGFCENYLRLPLTAMEPEHEKKLLALYEELLPQ